MYIVTDLLDGDLFDEQQRTGPLQKEDIRVVLYRVAQGLKALHDHNWIQKRSEGTASLYRVQMDILEADQQQLWHVASNALLASIATEQPQSLDALRCLWSDAKVDSYGAAILGLWTRAP